MVGWHHPLDGCPYLGMQLARLLCPWDSPGQNTGMGCYSLLQGIFPTQGWKLCLLHCRQILYHRATREASQESWHVITLNGTSFQHHGIQSNNICDKAYGTFFFQTSYHIQRGHQVFKSLNEGRKKDPESGIQEICCCFQRTLPLVSNQNFLCKRRNSKNCFFFFLIPGQGFEPTSPCSVRAEP